MHFFYLSVLVLLTSAWAATLQGRSGQPGFTPRPASHLHQRSNGLLDLPLRDLASALQRRPAPGMTREQARPPKPGASVGSGMPGKKLADCQCTDKRSMSCLNGKCLCGKDNDVVAKPAQAFTGTIAEGLQAAGPILNAVNGGMIEGVRMAMKLGSWLIPGLPAAAKATMKALDKAWPPASFGNEKADSIVSKINSVL